jgi:hypothetical protein
MIAATIKKKEVKWGKTLLEAPANEAAYKLAMKGMSFNYSDDKKVKKDKTNKVSDWVYGLLLITIIVLGLIALGWKF